MKPCLKFPTTYAVASPTHYLRSNYLPQYVVTQPQRNDNKQSVKEKQTKKRKRDELNAQEEILAPNKKHKQSEETTGEESKEETIENVPQTDANSGNNEEMTVEPNVDSGEIDDAGNSNENIVEGESGDGDNGDGDGDNGDSGEREDGEGENDGNAMAESNEEGDATNKGNAESTDSAEAKTTNLQTSKDLLPPPADNRFDSLDISENTKKALRDMEFETMMPVQAKVLIHFM